MYSKNKGFSNREYSLTPPPGYDGSRFGHRSDGRDDAFPLYGQGYGSLKKGKKPPCQHKPEPIAEEFSHIYEEDDEFLCECCGEEKSLPEDENECRYSNAPCPCSESKSENKILSFLKNLSGEELLLIALIILLMGDMQNGEAETVLILALLLCVS